MIRLFEYHKKFSPHKTPVFPRMNCSFLRIKLQFTPEKTSRSLDIIIKQSPSFFETIALLCRFSFKKKEKQRGVCRIFH